MLQASRVAVYSRYSRGSGLGTGLGTEEGSNGGKKRNKRNKDKTPPSEKSESPTPFSLLSLAGRTPSLGPCLTPPPLYLAAAFFSFLFHQCIVVQISVDENACVELSRYEQREC